MKQQNSLRWAPVYLGGEGFKNSEPEAALSPASMGVRTQEPQGSVFERNESAKSTNLWLIIAAVIFIVLAFIISPKSARAEVIDKIAAVVNNEIITEVELGHAVTLKQSGKKQAIKDVNIRQETLDKLIEEKLFNQLMSKAKIEVSDDDLAKAIGSIVYKNRMTIEQLKAEVQAKGMTYESYKKEIESNIKRIKFINQVIGPQVKITEQDLRDYYQRNQEDFRGSQKAHIAEIVLSAEGITTQEEFDQLAKTAMSIVEKARHGGNFTALVKQYSKGPQAAEGGDLGMLDLKDLPPTVSEQVRQMKQGDVSPPIITSNAIVIVKLISLPELSSSDFDKLRDEIYQKLYDQKIEETMTNYIAKERRKAFVEIR